MQQLSILQLPVTHRPTSNLLSTTYNDLSDHTSLLKSAGSPGVTSHTTTGNFVPAPPLTENPNVPLPFFSLVLVNSTTRASDMTDIIPNNDHSENLNLQ